MNRAQMNAFVQRQADAWQRGDIEAILADFDEAALFISPGGQWVGHAAIRQVATAFWATVHSVEIEVMQVLVDGEHGAIAWRWTEVRRSNGEAHRADDAILFTLKNGKIVYWREYFDTAQF
jgi:uncharacterized protein (TIGR02246 family)